MAIAKCTSPAGEQKRIFWTTQIDACGDYQDCGDACGIPGLVLLPNSSEAVSGSFVDGDYDVDVQRASQASYFDASGVLQTAAHNVLRIEHDPVTGDAKGLLVEAASTNIILQSSNLLADWGISANAVVTADAESAPDGLVTADKLAPANGVTSFIGGNPTQLIPALQNQVVTYSRFIKNAGAGGIRIDLRKNNSSAHIAGIIFSLATGNFIGAPTQTGDMIVVSHASEELSNGWYRVSLTVSSSGADTVDIAVREFCYSAAGASFIGDGITGLYLWGAQFEVGDSATSYIPTLGTAVTRANDNAILSAGGTNDWSFTLGDGSVANFSDIAGNLEFSRADISDPIVVSYATFPLGKTFATNDWARSLLLNILNTDGRQPPTDCGVPPGTQGGHWSESYRDDGLRTGTLLRSALNKPITRVQEAVNIVRAQVQADAYKLVQLGVATRVDVTAEYAGSNRIAVVVSIYGPSSVTNVVNLTADRLTNGWVWQ